MVENIQNETFDKIDLIGQGIEKIIDAPIIFDIYTRLEISLG